jgi:large subunit ribosomal protein L7e
LFRGKCIPENIQKKTARDAKLLAATKAARAAAKAARVESRSAAAANAVKYAAEYAAEDKALIDNKRAAKKAGNYFVEGEPKIAFVIRTRG